ncbi:hypothetical protein U1769_24285 [Sphingomonas sp. ZT3P38]|uniref:hypothetical protein n=1 Tax=Parasphingomonas zepuensis TaxID=3096161 RepID=UPI002FC70072
MTKIPARDLVERSLDEAPGVVAAAARILGWAEIALAGAEFVYATRCYLPIGSEGAKAARELQERGLVHLKQRRVQGGSTINYVAERSSLPWERARPRAVPKAMPYRPAAGEAATINALYPVLRRAARFSRPCPTDAQLAERAGVEIDAIHPALSAMEQIGMIRIEPAKAPTLRLVSIVATGHRTGLVA